MKKLIFLIAILFAFSFTANAQNYPFGDVEYFGQTAVDTSTDVGNDTLTLTNQVAFADFAIDSTHTISANVSELRTGAMFYWKVKNESESSSDNTLKFDQNIAATDETVTTGKTSMIELFYDGSQFNIVAIKQID